MLRGRRAHWLFALGAAVLVAILLGLTHAFESQSVRADAPGATSQVVQRSIAFQGRSRSYWFYRPRTTAKSPPLLVVLPGDGFPTPGVPDYELLADRQGLLLAFPTTDSKWRDPSDEGFVGAVIDDVAAKDGTDVNRVFLMGGSAGGFAAYRMACGALSTKLAGVGGLFAGIVTTTAGVSGVKAVCSPRRPLTIAEIHGTSDPFVPYDGRPCQVSSDAGRMVCLPSQLELMTFWAQTDNCPAASTSTVQGSLRTTVWAPCAGGAAVELLTVDRGAHDLETLTVDGVAPMARLWSFLSAHAPSLALRASIASSRVVRAAAGKRLVVTLKVSAPCTARAVLIQRGKTVASGTFKLKAGKSGLSLRIGRARQGSSVLRLTLASADNGPVILTRRVTLPA